MVEKDPEDGLGWLGWLTIVAILGFFNAAILFIAYLGLQSAGILSVQPSRWDAVQTQVVSAQYAATPVGRQLLPVIFSRKGTPTPTAFAPPTPTPVTPLPFPTRNPLTPAAFTPSDNLPLSAYISGYTGHAPSLSLSKEAASAADWATFFKKTITEGEFQAKLPTTDNPEAGFVGDVNDPWGQIPPNSYGVHATTVAAILRNYGLDATMVRNMTLDQLRREVAQDRPVIIWVKGNMEPGDGVVYTSAEGRRVVVTPYENTMTVIGYDMTAATITVVNRGVEETYPISTFMRSWVILGNTAIKKG